MLKKQILLTFAMKTHDYISLHTKFLTYHLALDNEIFQ